MRPSIKGLFASRPKIFLPTGRNPAKLISAPRPWLGWAGPSRDDLQGGKMAVLISNPPAQGQMVSVRSRNWMMTDVAASTLPAGRLQAGLESPQRLLSLSSVEDAGLGEELQVIWEIVPGAKVIERVAYLKGQAAPTGRGSP